MHCLWSGLLLLLSGASRLLWLKCKMSTAQLADSPVRIFVWGCMLTSVRTVHQVHFYRYS